MAVSMFQKMFVTHPESVGESYLEHLAHAGWFAGMMMYGGFACLAHALIPGACEKTGSKVITLLHDRMVVNRVKTTMKEDVPQTNAAVRPALF
jgi:hypothetical protein